MSSEEIQELKAAFIETSDNEEEIETDDKARLVQEIITQGAQCRNLSSANLIGADLSSANLSGATLIDAILRSATLIDAILRSADLRSAILIGANLSGADLRSTDLSGAVVEEAQFGDNLGLSKEMKRDLKQRGAIFEDSPGERSWVLSRR